MILYGHSESAKANAQPLNATQVAEEMERRERLGGFKYKSIDEFLFLNADKFYLAV